MTNVDQPSAGVHGTVEISFVMRLEKTRLSHLYQRNPLRVLFPLPRGRELPTAVVVNSAGGLVSGDRLDLTITAGPQASALVTTQAAEKVYRSTGADCRIMTRIHVGAEGWLEWLPQETILFEGARLRRQTIMNLTSGARLMAGEMLIFGRKAYGERLTHGLIHDAWDVHYDNRLLWADALHIDGDLKTILEQPACFNGNEACAMMIYVAEDAPLQLDLARDLIAAEDVLGGVTSIGRVLVARWLGQEALALRRAYEEFWASFRSAVANLPPTMPRIWHV